MLVYASLTVHLRSLLAVYVYSINDRSQVAGNTFYPTLVRATGADGAAHLYIQHNGECHS